MRRHDKFGCVDICGEIILLVSFNSPQLITFVSEQLTEDILARIRPIAHRPTVEACAYSEMGIGRGLI